MASLQARLPELPGGAQTWSQWRSLDVRCVQGGPPQGVCSVLAPCDLGAVSPDQGLLSPWRGSVLAGQTHRSLCTLEGGVNPCPGMAPLGEVLASDTFLSGSPMTSGTLAQVRM